MKKNKLFVFLVAVQCLFFMPAFSQYSISGYVQDSISKENLPYANVVLFSFGKDSIVSAIATDINGTFLLSNLKNGKYRLMIDFIGKDKFYLSPILLENKNIKLGTLFLKSGVQLDEVVIESKKAAVDLKIDRKTFNISENQNAQGGSATDVLNNLPSVNVDQDGNIALRGSSNLRILIDGKPTGLNGENIATVLQQIPANTIENIELITVPSSKYDAESSGGVINIILKSNKKNGSFGNANVTYGNFDKINSSFAFGVKQNKITLDASYGFKYGNYSSSRYSSAKNQFIDTLIQFASYGNGLTNTPSHLGKINLVYMLKPKTELSLGTTANFGAHQSKGNTYYDWTYVNYPSKSTSRNSSTNSFNNNVITTISFKHDLKNKGELISFSSNHNYSNNSSSGDFTQEGAAQSEKSTLFSNEFNQNLDLVKRIKKSKVEFGGQHTFRQINNDFKYYSSYSLSNDFNYKDNISAAYAMITSSLKSWTLAVGYRMEYTFSDSRNQSTNLNIQRSYANHFPSLSISKKFSESSELGLNYSRRINRPNFSQLNPSPSFSDPFNLRTGNPNLIPGINDIAELSWLKRFKFMSLQSTLFYQKRTDRLRRIRFIDGNGVSNVMWVNYKSEDYFGLELYTTMKLGKYISTNFSTNLFQRITDGTNIDPAFSANFYGIESKLGINLKLPKGFSFQANGEYISRDVTVIGSILPRYFMDVSLQKKLLKDKAKIGVRLADAFNTKQFQIQTDAQNWIQEGIFKQETQILFVSFSYDFGKKSEKEQKDKKINKKESDDF